MTGKYGPKGICRSSGQDHGRAGAGRKTSRFSARPSVTRSSGAADPPSLGASASVRLRRDESAGRRGGALGDWPREPVRTLDFIGPNWNLPREPLDNTDRFRCRGGRILENIKVFEGCFVKCLVNHLVNLTASCGGMGKAPSNKPQASGKLQVPTLKRWRNAGCR